MSEIVSLASQNEEGKGRPPEAGGLCQIKGSLKDLAKITQI